MRSKAAAREESSVQSSGRSRPASTLVVQRTSGPATKETLVDALRPLVEDAALRREIGAASRAYVEQVHDIDRVADRLIDVYRSL